MLPFSSTQAIMFSNPPPAEFMRRSCLRSSFSSFFFLRLSSFCFLMNELFDFDIGWFIDRMPRRSGRVFFRLRVEVRGEIPRRCPKCHLNAQYPEAGAKVGIMGGVT